MLGTSTFTDPQRPLAVVVPRLRVGGADSYVRDALSSVPSGSGYPKVLLYVIHGDRGISVPYEGVEFVKTCRSGSVYDRVLTIVKDLVERRAGFVLVQLLSFPLLELFWAAEIQTGIIFQNEEPTWSYSPRALRPDKVPFLVATFDAMADRLRSYAPAIPIQTIRPMPDVNEHAGWERAAKKRWDVPETAVVLGMVGGFKLHKRYTFAVRILKALRDRGLDAYLCIAGGHTEKYGGGPQAYDATLKLATRLGMEDYLRCPGEVKQAEELYASFDLFLNTSLYEGLSRATLTAATHGCPVLATAVGGHPEILLPPNRTLSVDASLDAFAVAALACLGKGWQPPTYLQAQRTSQAAWVGLWKEIQGDCCAPQLLSQVN